MTLLDRRRAPPWACRFPDELRKEHSTYMHGVRSNLHTSFEGRNSGDQVGILSLGGVRGTTVGPGRGKQNLVHIDSNDPKAGDFSSTRPSGCQSHDGVASNSK